MEINLEQHRDLDSVFATCNIEAILLNLQAQTGQVIGAGSILFLDEIQATPHALATLRYFYEERPDIPLIAAGSLLQFALADHAFSMPVGRISYLHLGPMTFREFLAAAEPNLCGFLDACIPDAVFPIKAHERLLAMHRHYLLVGGMPEAVDVFRTTSDPTQAQGVLESVAATYRDDFAKYSRQKDLADLQAMFRHIHAYLAVENGVVTDTPWLANGACKIAGCTVRTHYCFSHYFRDHTNGIAKLQRRICAEQKSVIP